MITDTHCHIHFQAYKEDMEEVIRRNQQKGVRMISIGTQSSTSKMGIEVAERYDGVWTTVGLHPNHTVVQTFYDEDELPPEEKPTGLIRTRAETFDPEYYRPLALHPKCVAIGECGLDYYRLPENVDRDVAIDTQKTQVRAQFDLADELNLPVVIHCRDAHADQIAIIKEYTDAGRLSRRGVVHCFTGTLEEAERYVAVGFYISFTGILCFPDRKQPEAVTPLQEVAQALPIGSLLIETDAPYLTPPPHRGKRNEPWMVEFVAKKIADLHRIPVEAVIEQTNANADALFNLT